VQRGFTLSELVVVLALMSVLAVLLAPRLGPAFDRIATEGAARDLTTAIAVARAAAVMEGTRARLHIDAESLWIDRERPDGWEPYARWPGPAAAGVALSVSNPQLTFGPLGVGWGVSNTRVVLWRGSQTATITTSRLGRVRRR
jgi:prepilin-type N-terminal cleavage/methylation domain-containing protein